MRFIKSTSAAAVAHLVTCISDQLTRGRTVLWLVSGGSTVNLAVEARDQLTTTEGLHVMQVDERFGMPGHPDSNWQALIDAGFDLNGVVYQPTLRGGNLISTTAVYEENLNNYLTELDYSIGLFGIGADGHTAGILPHSPAAEVDNRMVAEYEGPDFSRITMAPSAFERLDMAVAYAEGQLKHQALSNLQSDLPMTSQPAQLLKRAAEAYIFNDYIGDAQ